MKKTLKNFSLFVLCLFFISIIGCSEPNKEPTVVYVPQDNGGNNGGTQTPKTGTLVIQNRILQSNYDRLEYQIYGPNDYSNLYTVYTHFLNCLPCFQTVFFVMCTFVHLCRTNLE